MAAPRLTRPVRQILAVLYDAAPEPMHGIAVAEAAHLWTANTYPALHRLEDEFGLLRSEWEAGDPSKLGRPLQRLYRLTSRGHELARALDEGQDIRFVEWLPGPGTATP